MTVNDAMIDKAADEVALHSRMSRAYIQEVDAMMTGTVLKKEAWKVQLACMAAEAHTNRARMLVESAAMLRDGMRS